MGMPVDAEGVNHGEDLNLACATTSWGDARPPPGRHGSAQDQPHVIASVAVDLRISNVVDVPNVTVSALLPEEIFQG